MGAADGGAWAVVGRVQANGVTSGTKAEHRAGAGVRDGQTLAENRGAKAADSGIAGSSDET